MRRQHLRLLQAVAATPWVIMEEKLQAILSVLDGTVEIQSREIPPAPEPYLLQLAGSPAAPSGGKVSVIPVYGILAQRMDMILSASGGTATERLGKQIDAAVADTEVRAIVLDMDSPGGDVASIPELAAKIYAGRQKKRIVAVANSMMASGAYWLGAAATEVVASPSSSVGSVGVFVVHMDASKANETEGVTYTVIRAGKFKAEGLPVEPLTPEARDFYQERVNETYDMFVKALADYRDVSVKVVRDSYGQGRTLSAAGAKAAGMVDRVATLEETLARLGVGSVGVGNTTRQRAQAARARGLSLLD